MTSDSQANRRFRDVIYEALAGAETAAGDADPLILLDRLCARARAAAPDDPIALTTVAGLDKIALQPSLETAVAAAAQRFQSPERFRDAIYFARCLAREPAQTLALLTARRYLEDATVPPELADLRTDRQAVLDATGFATLWQEPGRAAWMLNTTEIWRREYMLTYLAQHVSFNSAVAGLAEQVDQLAPAAAAVERLNGLRRLGPPAAATSLAQFHEMERLFACGIESAALLEALDESPICPECGFRLGEQALTAALKRLRSAIERALLTQKTRLAQRVVSRLLDRPAAASADRLDRFVQVVQASDLSGLALVLDDGLIAFLRDLLEADPEPDPLRRLADAYPEVTPANLDDAVDAFRSLLESELALRPLVRLDGQGGAS